MADHSKPTLSSTYPNFVAEVKGRLDDVSRQFDPANSESSNLVMGAIRWTSAAKKWEIWNGASWGNLATEYAISISGTATKLKTARSITLTGGATAAAVNFDGSANITLNVTELNPAQLSAAVPINKGGTGASDAVQARASLGLGTAATTSASDYAAKSHAHAWNEITGKPTAFPPASHSHVWGEISGKPATFPPVIGTAANQAKAGNWAPDWSEVRNKPAIPPAPQATQSKAVGSYCVLRNNKTVTSATIADNEVVAGSQLLVHFGASNSSSLPGTWRNVSGNTLQNKNTTASNYGIFVRVT